MEKKIKVGFIGAGGIAQSHLRALKTVNNVEITGIFDIREESAREVADMYNSRSVTDPGELLDRTKVDALFICTPPFGRGDYESRAALQGIHLFVEKPPALQLDEAKEKAAILRQSGVITASGHSSRYAHSVQKAKKFLESRQIDLLHVYRYHGLPPQPWLAQLETSGGQMVDQTIHEIDLIRYLAGEFKEVYSRYKQRSLHQVHPEADIPDVGAVSFELKSGAIGTVTTTNLQLGYPRRDLTLIGHEFSVTIDRAKETVTLTEGSVVSTFKSPNIPIEAQDKAFIEAVRSGQQEKVLCSFDEALRTLEVVLAMNASATNAVPVLVGALEGVKPV